MNLDEGYDDPTWVKPLVTEYTRDSEGRTASETRVFEDATKSEVTTMEYDANSNLSKVTDARGFETSYEYDFRNRLRKTKYPATSRPDGAADLVLAEETRYYDGRGNLVSIIDANGNTTWHGYDSRNRRTSTIVDLDGDGVKTHNDIRQYTSYDRLGSMISSTDPQGTVTLWPRTT
ncbi:MAG: RHS repeat domain-containing protein [Verrucomicrobiota bacterium]